MQSAKKTGASVAFQAIAVESVVPKMRSPRSLALVVNHGLPESRIGIGNVTGTLTVKPGVSGALKQQLHMSVAFAALPAVKGASKNVVRGSVAFASAAWQISAVPHGKELVRPTFGLQQAFVDALTIAQLRGITIAVKSGLSAAAPSGGRSVAISFAVRPSAAGHGAQHYGLSVSFAWLDRFAGSARPSSKRSGAMSIAAGYVDGAKGSEGNPSGEAHLDASMGLRGAVRVTGKVSGRLGIEPGAGAAARHAAPAAVAMVVWPGAIGARKGSEQTTAAFSIRPGFRGAASTRQLLGRSMPSTLTAAGAAKQVAKGRGQFAIRGVALAPSVAAKAPAISRLPATLQAVAHSSERQARALVLALAGRVAGRFSVSIRAAPLGLKVAETTAPTAKVPVHAVMAATSKLSTASPLPRARVRGTIAAAFRVRGTAVLSGSIAQNFAIVARALFIRFINTRGARKFAGQASRGQFSGAGERGQFVGRASGGNFTGRE